MKLNRTVLKPKGELMLMVFALFLIINAQSQDHGVNQGKHSLTTNFEAKGPTQPVKLDPAQRSGAIQVSFDLLPTTMSFNLPWFYSMVIENGIKFSTLATESYDPRDFDGTGGAASFEPGIDLEVRYVRAWIEQQSNARIVVRIRYALYNNLYDIAHPYYGSK